MGFPFAKIAAKNLFSKPSTVNFPAVNVDAKPGYRGRIAYEPEKCVNCGMCIKVCSPGAITRITEPAEGGENITYEFDLTSCTFCATCEDFCSTKAIHLTEDYHMVATDPKELIVTGTRFKKAVAGYPACGDACVFCTLCAKVCPEGAIEVDRANKVWKLNKEVCVQCGICESKCPKKCITMTDTKGGGAAETQDDAAAQPKVEETAAESRSEATGYPACGDACVFCTLCAKMCPCGAIQVDRDNKEWKLDKDVCIQCGVCASKCPKKCITMTGE